ncbi:FAD-binding oxidoreductase [Roseateles toxinivorans]|uniref:FAD binding domain-containing protein n=1 Tax=Roseateles toxinivorans TaxID=270368 RepID=A0A4R6QUD8_9BURK|nr:FAD-binding oxidoreductase [Roseateles toxinivorans]TDP74599.1 FAD binding domain-containing protein [Roseateles toxinivorans]
MSANLDEAVAAWQTLLGADQVILGEAVPAIYGMDASGVERRVPAALRVLNVELVADAIRIAHQYRVAVYPLSTGHNWGYGTAMPAQDDCVIVDLSALNRILHFDAGLGVVTVEPGVTQGMLARFLDEGGHDYMVPVTGAGPNCSLLGNALERGYGVTPYTDHFGAVTDIEAVLADGSVYRSALREAGNEDLARLFKWGIGPYLNGLFTQSGFGVVTRMSILLAKRPESIKVCLFSLKDDALLEPAVERIQAILRKLPGTVGAINLMNRHRVLAMSAPYPWGQLDARGLIPVELVESMGRQYQILPWTGFATLYGTQRIVAAAQAEIRQTLKGVASRVLFFSEAQTLRLAKWASWIPGQTGQRLAKTAGTLAKSLELVGGRPNETALPLAYWRNPRPFIGEHRDPSRDGCGLMWFAPLVPMRADGVRRFVEMVKEVAPKHGMEPLITLTTLSDKVFDSTVPLVFDLSKEEQLDQARACRKQLWHRGSSIGCFPYRVGVDDMAELSTRHPAASELLAKLQQAIAPGIGLAPGRYR